MNINFQSDDLNCDNSVSSYSSAFSFDNDDIPNLNDKNPSNYSSKNVEKALSNQFHNLIIGEVSSAHLDTLQTTYVGFPKNTELEGGLKHKSRTEIAIESTKNITPQLEQLIFEYLNISLENAVSLSAKNYGADFVKNQNSEEEEEGKNNNNNNNNIDKEFEEDNEEEEKEIVFDQEITLNDKNEGKKPTFFNSLKSLFNKPKDNEANDDENNNTSLNDSSSWLSKANIKRSKSVGPKSNIIFHTDDKNDSKNGDENITESEEKSKKKNFFNSFPFFKSKTNDEFENNANDENSFKNESNSSPKQITKTQSATKINFKNIFAKPKETKSNNEKTVRFANLNEEEEDIEQPPNIGENIDQNEGQIPIEPENKQPVVMVENLEDFSSASDSESDSQRCHTPNSNPSVDDDLFVVQESDQETDEEMVKNLIRPPTPEKEVNIKFSSESEPFDKKLNKNQNQKEEAKEISFDSDTNSGNDSKNNNNQNNSFHSNESKSIKDQDLLLSASESESETASSKNNNKITKDHNDKKTKSNLYNLHLSSSSSEPEDNNDEKTQKNKTKAKDELDETKTKGKSLIELGQNEEVIKQTMSNVEFIANELSDFQVDQKDITNEQLNSPQTNSQTQKTIKYSNPKLNKREPLKISNQSSQTNTHREIQSRRKQNVIQENTYFEVFEDKTNMKRVRRKKINLTVNVKNEEEEENENQIFKSKKRFVYSNSNSSSQNSPKGRSSNSSSPHSNRHNYSPVHTHTHTPVPVKPRLILKNNSSSDDYDDDDFDKRKTKSNRIETDTPKSNKHRTIRKNSSISTENLPSHDKSSPPPAIRKRKPQIKSRKTETENYKIAEFHNSASPKKRNQRRDEIDDDNEEKDSLSPITQTTRLIKRKKRASSEKRIKTRNPQLTISTMKNKKIEIEEEEEEKEIEESSKRNSRKKIVKKRRKPSLSTSQTQTTNHHQQNDFDENEDRKTKSQIAPNSRLTRSSSELKSRTLASSSRSRRRLSADNSLIDRKTLAKNGVRSIILIEFDKKTPLIENLLEQFSSNTETLSLPSPKTKRRRSHSVSEHRITKNDDNDDEETVKSSRSVRPKITRHAKNRSLNRSKITDQNDENDEMSISFDDEKTRDDELNTNSENRVKKIRKKRQNSVKPSSLNRTIEPQKRNIGDLNKKEENHRSVKATNTIAITRSKTESENHIQPLRKNESSGRRRMESVKSERTLKRNIEQSEDYHNVRFNFKKLFDEAERNERRENQ